MECLLNLTSAAGMPSGGRHWSNTSCSRDTSFPRGSWSNVFLKSMMNRQKHIVCHLPISYQQADMRAVWRTMFNIKC